MTSRSVATEVHAFANVNRLYRAMRITAFGTPEEMDAIQQHVKRDMGRVQALMLSGDADADADGGIMQLLDGMIHRSLFGASTHNVSG